MGSINKSHNEVDGGILLYSGEPILLYCDSVSVEIGGKETIKGRVYLTTHRMVVVVSPYRQNSAVKSLCAPFCAIKKINLEQPIFGANYIEATVADEIDPNKTFSFKMKFAKGGAIEYAMTMNRAVGIVRTLNQATTAPAPNAYTPSPTDSYYQAPPTVYAPGYNCGVNMPVNQFPDQPPIGFIYTSSAPPPYPGLGDNLPHQQYPQQPQQQQYPQQPQQQQYPQQPQQQQYPQQPQQQQYPQQPQQQQQYPGTQPAAPPPPYQSG